MNRSSKPNDGSTPWTNESTGSNSQPVTELGKLLERGDFGRRDSQVNITVQGRSQSLRPGNGRKVWAVVGALTAAILALVAAIWKLCDLLGAFN